MAITSQKVDLPKTTKLADLGSVTAKTKGGYTATAIDRNWGRIDWY